MGIFFYLASAEGGFGLSFDIFEANLINLSIILVAMFVFGRRLLSNILSERQAKIEAEIAAAEGQANEAAVALADAQQSLAQAKVEAGKIREQAQVSAERAKSDVLAKGRAEVEKLKAVAAADLSSEQDRAIAELRKRVTALALAKVESRLNERLGDDSMQEQLLNRTIAQLGG
ncbi:MAG: F0F1 ATP synthase subunit B [Cyanobacteria bacterium P01_G01_bin.54]